jgi:MFS family permease
MPDVSNSRPRFWTRDFSLSLGSYFCLFMSVTLFYLYPLYFERLGTSRGRIGLIMGVHSLLAILIRPVFGRLIDRKGGRTISLAGILFFMAVIPLFHFVRDAGWLPLALRALTGLAWGISMTATMAICSDLAPLDRLAHSLGVIGVAGIVASALGPVLAEEATRRFGFGGLFNASFAFLAASFAFMFLTKEIPKPERDPLQPASRPFRGLQILPLIVVAAMPIFHGAVRGAVVNFIALFGKSVPFERVGPFFFVFSAAAIITRLGFGDLSDRYGRKVVILPAAALISLNLFWISRVQSFPIFLLNGFIAGLGQGLIFPALSTYVIDLLGREHKGFALSLYLALFDTGMGLGSPFFGWVSDKAGYRTMYVVAGALLLAATGVFAFAGPKRKGPYIRGAKPRFSNRGNGAAQY